MQVSGKLIDSEAEPCAPGEFEYFVLRGDPETMAGMIFACPCGWHGYLRNGQFEGV